MLYNKTILYSLPTATIEVPSPALSVLKTYLSGYSVQIKVKYINVAISKILEQFLLQFEVGKEKGDDNILLLFPFLKYLADKYKDRTIQEKLIHHLKTLRPDEIIKNPDFFESVLDDSICAINKAFIDEIGNDRDVLLHGFTARYNQWIPAIFCSDIIKEKNPDQPIVIGGFDSEEEARSYMQMCDCFDFAIWGEGEIPLLQLCRTLKDKTSNFEYIPRLIYRNKGDIISSQAASDCSTYIDLNEILPDFSDYFEYATKYNIPHNDIFLPIENARGCKWNQCKFCVINAGYKYKSKSNEKIVEEIKGNSDKYKVNNFLFVGSDIAGFDYKNFETLLDMLLRLTCNSDIEFNFVCELIPKNVSEEIIKKMAILNFTVQIGYESTSDLLLKKMNKCTRFIDLLLFVKLAYKYCLRIDGANIITNIPGETEEDVVEAIDNLPFLRFYLGENGFHHNIIPLAIKKGSEFFNSISEEEKKHWNKNKVFELLSKKIIEKLDDRFSTFYFTSDYNKNERLWDEFKIINKYYEIKKYKYFVYHKSSEIMYKEVDNNIMIKFITFDNPIYIEILRGIKDKIINSEDLLNNLNARKYIINLNEFIKRIRELRKEKLIYCSNNRKPIIISIIKI